uniref:Uncharacterized protein n=1 Tax=Siphoviridae sp. ct2D011 TaxID=2825314 RepID=A0A8S5V9D0_9CAUD|nr:MAG TPA: hypothetical protein [Siphoviridae sp. ct2D011]
MASIESKNQFRKSKNRKIHRRLRRRSMDNHIEL